MSVYKTGGTPYQTTPAFSATQQNKRDVWDKILMLYARNAPLIAMIANGKIGKDGIQEGPGMIAKHMVNAVRFESYNYTPPTKYATATADLSGTTLAIDTTYIKAYDTLFNPETETYARVDSVTNAAACEITSYGTTAFSVASGDVLMINGTAYPEFSSDPTILTKDFDNVYNTLMISREPVAISNTMTKLQFYATNDYTKLLKKVNFINFLDKIERSWLFGDRASGTGNTTAGGAALTSAFRTTRGAYNWAANRYDMGGNLTMFKIRTEIPEMVPVVSSTEKMIMLLGTTSYGYINELMNDQAMYMISGEESKLKKYGVTTKKIMTNNFELELITHDSFNIGAMQKRGLLLAPENCAFTYLKDRDIRPVSNLQDNDADGKIDEVAAEFGNRTLDGGQSSCIIDNIW